MTLIIRLFYISKGVAQQWPVLMSCFCLLQSTINPVDGIYQPPLDTPEDDTTMPTQTTLPTGLNASPSHLSCGRLHVISWSTGGRIRLLGSHPALLQLMKLSYEFTADKCIGYWLTINIPAVSKHLQPLHADFSMLMSRQDLDSLLMLLNLFIF